MRFQIGAFFPTRDMPADRAAIRDWAQAADTINYEIVTRFGSARVPRVYSGANG